MSYSAHHKDFSPDVVAAAAPIVVATADNSPNFWRRIFDALFEPEHRRLQREASQFLAQSGGLLTDNLEREMMQTLIKPGR